MPVREQELPASGPVSRPRGWPLATLLFLFGATLIVPSIVANGLLLQRQATLQQQDIERRVEQVASDLVDGIDRDLAFMEAMVTVMAASPDLAAGRLAQFHVWATQILQPLGLHVLYRDLDGQQLLNTRVSFDTPLPRESLPEIDAAVADAIVADREGRAEGYTSIVQLQEVAGMGRRQLANIYELLCVRSSVYVVTSRGRDARTGLEVEMMATLDRSRLPVVLTEVLVR